MKPNSLNRFCIKRLLVVTGFFAMSVGAHADLTWNSAGPTNNWSTAVGNGNWTGGVVWTQNENAIFDATSGTPEAVSVTTANTFNNITFDVSGFSITNGAGSLLLANDQASTIKVTTGTASIAESIANNGAGISTLTKTGAGTLTLSNTNAYTGLTSVNEGRLIVTGTLGNNSSAFVDTGATLEFNSATYNSGTWTGGLTGSGTVEINRNAQNFGGNNTAFAGSVNVLSGARLNLTTSNSGSANAAWVTTGTGILSITVNGTYEFGSLSGPSGSFFGAGGGSTNVAIKIGALNTDTTFSGTINGSGTNFATLEKVGNGKLTLSGLVNSYAGSTTVSGGTLEAFAFAAGGSNSSIGKSSNAASNLVINGGTLKFSGTTGNGSTDRLFTIGTNGATIDGSSSDNTALTFTNTGSLATTAGATDRTLTLTGTTNTATLNTLASVIVDPTGVGKTAVTKSGSNTWVLTNTNTYTGATTIKAGTLALSGSGSLASTSIIVGDPGSSGAVLDVTAITGGTYAPGAGKTISGIGTVNAAGKNVTIAGSIAPGNSAGLLSVSTTALTLSGAMNIEMTSGLAPVAGTNYDQLGLTGTLTITGAALTLADLNIGAGAYPLNSIYFLIANDGTDAITGTFNGFAEGGQITFDGQQFKVTYLADSTSGQFAPLTTGNDFALMAVPEPSAALLGGLGVLALIRRRRN